MKAAALPPRHSRSHSAIFPMVGRLVWAVLAGLLVDPSRAGAIGAPALLPASRQLPGDGWPDMTQEPSTAMTVQQENRPRT